MPDPGPHETGSARAGTLRDALRGTFIVLDGPDGSGKSTQFRRLCDTLRSAGLEVVETREPGGTAVGERIRDVLLDPIHGDMTVRCEMLLYMASRAQLVERVIRPAVARGATVVADRFVSSTLAYQGTAGGLAQPEIMAVAATAVGGTWPDLTVIFDVDEITASRRLSPLLDRMEQKGLEFHRRVRDGYLAQVRAHPDAHLVVDASQDVDAVTESLFAGLASRLGAVKAAQCARQ
jgi:dTMP kinase